MSSLAEESPAPSSSGELPIIEASLDLIRWFVPLLNRLPRQHKFGLGERRRPAYPLPTPLPRARDHERIVHRPGRGG
jgi:hypothetical protein